MTTFDDQEVALLILALRFWRAQRRDGQMRRTDPAISPQMLEALLARLEARRLEADAALGSPDPLDPFGELSSR